jgi:hypothetical protein
MKASPLKVQIKISNSESSKKKWPIHVAPESHNFIEHQKQGNLVLRLED